MTRALFALLLSALPPSCAMPLQSCAANVTIVGPAQIDFVCPPRQGSQGNAR